MARDRNKEEALFKGAGPEDRKAVDRLHWTAQRRDVGVRRGNEADWPRGRLDSGLWTLETTMKSCWMTRDDMLMEELRELSRQIKID